MLNEEEALNSSQAADQRHNAARSVPADKTGFCTRQDFGLSLMPYQDYHLQTGPSMDLAPPCRHGPAPHMLSHYKPQEKQKPPADTSMYGTRSTVHNENNYNANLPLVRHHMQQPPRAQQHHAPQHHPENHRNNTRQQPNRPQLSPNFHSRSSPIAIIHNPEDNVNQAKLRWQHPMYDTSDDEADDDDMGNISAQSLTSPLALDAPRNSAPQSLPTALLRAPKLGSLPSQDYRLHHLATLPPPMSLGDQEDTAMQEPETTNTAHFGGESFSQKPKYLSSYGSLRECHLTGRFGVASQAAYSTGHLHPEEKQQMSLHDNEPPATLIPPRNPAPTPPNLQHLQPPQKPAKNVSIRDRMMQRAQQQKEEASKETRAEKKSPSSSLSAMLAKEGTNYGVNDNGFGSITHQRKPVAPAAQKVLPASMANAVAISYNSNLNLFARAQQSGQLRRNSKQMYTNALQGEASMLLSSSMTGLEVLRAASKARPATTRPTSLSILQDSPRSMQMEPPLATTHQPTAFLHLSRTMSEPKPHSIHLQPQQRHQPHTASHHNTTAIFSQARASLSPPPLAQETYDNIPRTTDVVLRMPDGRTLIPPQSLRSPGLAQNSGAAVPWGVPTTGVELQSFSGQLVDEPNPDTQEAFDMEM